MRKPVSVDYDPGDLKPGDRLTILARFNTLAEAEAYIENRASTDPEGVYDGRYGINAPEEMING